MPSNSPERIWYYDLDAEGHFWHEGYEFDEPSIIQVILKSLEPIEGNRYHAFCQGEECIIRTEDVPYVVQNMDMNPENITLIFSGGYKEPLDPTSLFIGKNNIPYCRVRNGKFLARFNRKSYFELAKKIEFDPQDKVFYLSLGDKRYNIQGTF